MNEGNIHPNVRPAAAPAETKRADSGTADAYRRAVQAKPTDFAENPIGAMALAMDKIGKAAVSRLGKGADATGAAGNNALAKGEERLASAAREAKAAPNSIVAKQKHLKAAAALLQDMQRLAPDHPKRVHLAAMVVSLASSLGPGNIPFNVPGLDMRGILGLAAGIVSRFGDAAAMQKAFGLEQMLRSTLGGSVEAVQLRDQLLRQFGVSRSAAQTLASGWTVKLTGQGELPHADVSARTISINASQANPSLAVLAKAYWHDTSLRNPVDKDGFINAFVKIANSGGFTTLSRKYKEVRRMARTQLSASPQMSSVGGVVNVGSRNPRQDESGDMFAALAVFSRTPEGQQLPDSVKAPVERFFA